MRLVADISAWQTHDANDWTIRRPYDLGAFASAVDAAWVRWTDWYGYVRWGADPDYALCVDTLRSLGRPVGAYLYPRPGMGDPLTQVRTWHAATPPLTFDPMLDPEDQGGLSGRDLTVWIDQALAEMTRLWGRTPWLYTQASKISAWGLSQPSTPHRLMLAGYPFGYDPFPWGQRAGWEARAYSRGVDQPAGWAPYGCWQFTSSAEVPGMPGGIDCSLMTEGSYLGSAAGGDDGFGPADRAALEAVHRALV